MLSHWSFSKSSFILRKLLKNKAHMIELSYNADVDSNTSSLLALILFSMCFNYYTKTPISEIQVHHLVI